MSIMAAMGFYNSLDEKTKGYIQDLNNQDPSLQGKMMGFMIQNPDALDRYSQTYKQDPAQFRKEIGELAGKLSDNPSVKKIAEGWRMEGPAEQKPAETPQQPQADPAFDTRFAARTGVGAPSPTVAAAGGGEDSGGGAPATKAAAGGAALAGIDMSNLGGGLTEMFSKFQEFFAKLPEILNQFVEMLGQMFSGLKNSNNVMSAESSPNGPGAALRDQVSPGVRVERYGADGAELKQQPTVPVPEGPKVTSVPEPWMNPTLEPSPQRTV